MHLSHFLFVASSLCWSYSEWEPGRIVFRFSPDGGLFWTALRSPIPDFGGRKAAAEDVRKYDEDAENHQYSLVFRAWDAQFDEFWGKDRGFRSAGARTAGLYEAALALANELGEQLQARYSDDGNSYRASQVGGRGDPRPVVTRIDSA